MSVNSGAMLQSGLSLVAALTCLEAIREIPSIYASKEVTDVAVAKFALAVLILIMVMIVIWKFGTAEVTHVQPQSVQALK